MRSSAPTRSAARMWPSRGVEGGARRDRGHVALGGDERVERVEQHADRRREPQAFPPGRGWSSRSARADWSCSDNAACWRIADP